MSSAVRSAGLDRPQALLIARNATASRAAQLRLETTNFIGPNCTKLWRVQGGHQPANNARYHRSYSLTRNVVIGHRRRLVRPRKPSNVLGCASGQWGYVLAMAWQEPAALGLVALTGLLFAWRIFWPRRAQLGKGSPCGGCASATPIGPQPSIKYRARKDGHSEVTVRWK
jgi:hypothetical protein